MLERAHQVLTRSLLAKSQTETGLKIRFTDKRKAAKSLAFRIFNAKKATKDELYPDLLRVAQWASALSYNLARLARLGPD